MSFEIRSDIPLPNYRRKEPSELLARLQSMTVGQSLIVELEQRKKLMSAACNMNRRDGWNFKCRAFTDQDGRQKYGAWCTGKPESLARAPVATPAPLPDLTPPLQAGKAATDSPLSERLRDVAKLHPTGKRAAHITK